MDEEDQDPAVAIELEISSAEQEEPANVDPLGPSGEEGPDLSFLGDDSEDEDANDDRGSEDLDIGHGEGVLDVLRDIQRRGAPGDEEGFQVANAPDAHAHDDFFPAFEDRSSPHGDEANDAEPVDEGEDELPGTADDGGAEGIGDGSESTLDEASLPAIDADGAGEFELHDLLEELGFGGDEPWEVVPHLSTAVALSSVVCRDGFIVGAGSAVVVIERAALVPRVRAIPEEASSCVWLDGSVVLATRVGAELIEASSVGATTVLLEHYGVTSLAYASGQLWVLAGTMLGRLEVATAAYRAVREDVLALSAAHGTVFIASVARRGSLERLRGHDGDFEPIDVDEAARSFIQRGATIAACTASSLVIVNAGRGLLVDVDGRSSALPVDGILAATYRGQGSLSRALLLASHAGRLELHSIPASGEPGVASDIPLDAAPGSYGLAWDASRELLLVAGPHGLAALRPRLRH